MTHLYSSPRDFLVLHIGQAIGTRKWYLLATAVLCGIAEIIGCVILKATQFIYIDSPLLDGVGVCGRRTEYTM